jgi:hypothetical protein
MGSIDGPLFNLISLQLMAVDAGPSFAVTFTGFLGGSSKPGASLDVIAPTTGPTLVTFPQAFAGVNAVSFVTGVPGFSIDDLTFQWSDGRDCVPLTSS